MKKQKMRNKTLENACIIVLLFHLVFSTILIIDVIRFFQIGTMIYDTTALCIVVVVTSGLMKIFFDALGRHNQRELNKAFL